MGGRQGVAGVGPLTIPIDIVRLSDDHIRKTGFSTGHLKETIADAGLLQPILVRKEGNGFVVIDGARRLAALRELGVQELIIGRDLIIDIEETEADTRFKQIIANVQREDLNDIELGQAFVTLKEEFDYRYNEIAEIIGKTPHFVTAKVGLIKRLDPEVRRLYLEDLSEEKCTYNTFSTFSAKDEHDAWQEHDAGQERKAELESELEAEREAGHDTEREEELSTERVAEHDAKQDGERYAKHYVISINVLEDIARMPRELQLAAYLEIRARQMDQNTAIAYLRALKNGRGEAATLAGDSGATGTAPAKKSRDPDIRKHILKIRRYVDRLADTMQSQARIEPEIEAEIEAEIDALIERLNALRARAAAGNMAGCFEDVPDRA